MNGFLLIDKPAGPTSHDIIDILRKKTGIKKMGHTGTLDPFATGLLIVAVGRATKLIPLINDEPKVYQATLKLGEATDTLDREGKIVETKPVPPLDSAAIESVLKSFLGKTSQIPPMFSAKKIAGKKMYELARKGIEVERKPVEIEIFDMGLVGATPCGCPEMKGGHRGPPLPTISFRVSCSRGTYVRVLGADIAKILGTVGHLTELRREKSGPFDVRFAKSPNDVVLERDLTNGQSAINQMPFSF